MGLHCTIQVKTISNDLVVPHISNLGVNALSNEAREEMLAARGLISKSLLEHYQHDKNVDSAIQLGTLYLDMYTYAKVREGLITVLVIKFPPFRCTPLLQQRTCIF